MKNSYISFSNSGEKHQIDEVLRDMKMDNEQATGSDIEILQRVCAAVSIRAARLAAAGVATIVKVCIV